MTETGPTSPRLEYPSGIRMDLKTPQSTKNVLESAYLRFPELERHRSFFGEMDVSRIVGEWANGTVLLHPTKPWVVVKVSKLGNVDDLAKEYESACSFYKTLETGRAEYPDDLPKSVAIPKPLGFSLENGGRFEMELIKWTNLRNLFYLSAYWEKQEFFRWLPQRPACDFEIESALAASRLPTLPKVRVENDFEGIELSNSLRSFYDKKLYATALWNVLDFLEWKGHRHDDLINNPGNAMEDADGRSYLIDFWRVTIR